MGVCTVECNSGSCRHVFRWGFTFSDGQHSSIQVPFSIQTLTCLIFSSFYLPPQQLHDLRVAAGAHTEQLVSCHSCICGLSRTGQCRLCCCRLCHFYWLYTRYMTVNNVTYYFDKSVPYGYKRHRENCMFSCVSCPRWYIGELLQGW